MNDIDIQTLEKAISLRFGRYSAWAAGDKQRAITLYTLNTQLSESLYTPLQMLEVALRNRIHAVLSAVPTHEIRLLESADIELHRLLRQPDPNGDFLFGRKGAARRISPVFEKLHQDVELRADGARRSTRAKRGIPGWSGSPPCRCGFAR
jgi:hypothetical protein